HVKIDEPYPVPAGLPILLKLDRHSLDEPAVKLTVSLDQAGNVGIAYKAPGVLMNTGGEMGIKALDRLPQTAGEHHLPIRLPLPARRMGVRRRNVRAVGHVQPSSCSHRRAARS